MSTTRHPFHITYMNHLPISLIIIGGSSSLASEFTRLYHSMYKQIFLFVRDTQSPSEQREKHLSNIHDSYNNVQIVRHPCEDTHLIDVFNRTVNYLQSGSYQDHEIRVFNFQTSPSINFLKTVQSRKLKSLTISSGAVEDWEQNRQGFIISELGKLNDT